MERLRQEPGRALRGHRRENSRRAWEPLYVRVRRRALWAAGVLVATAVLAGCGLPSDGTQSYRPDAADVVARADCGLPDIVHRLQFGENTSADNIPREGSLPSGFEPSGVVVCELSEGANGSGSIDAVSLNGDVARFAEAINRPSERYDDNISYSCALPPVEAPAAVYLVSPAGAVRMRWPSVICGLRGDPLQPLESLTETGRVRVSEIERLVPSQCSPSVNVAFTRTPESRSVPPALRRPAVGLPEREAMGLTACTYRVSTTPTGDATSALIAQKRLTASSSTQLIRNVLNAPSAVPCGLNATEVVRAELFRPDGSGGGRLQAEIDGCRRVTVDDFLSPREASGDITALLQGRP